MIILNTTINLVKVVKEGCVDVTTEDSAKYTAWKNELLACMLRVQRYTHLRINFAPLMLGAKKPVKCYVWSRDVNGAENWTLRKSDQKHLESFKMWCRRRIIHCTIYILILVIVMFPKKLVEKKIVAYCKAAFLVTGLKNSEAEPVTSKLRSSRYKTRPNDLTWCIPEKCLSKISHF
jgi:hypothetical protein